MNSLNRKYVCGVTLLELLAAMAMVAILAGIAVPAFQTMIEKNRQSSTLNDFSIAVSIARSEAVKRGIRTVICTSSDGASCDASADWHVGWIIFVDANSNNGVDSGEQLIRVGAALETGFSLVGTSNVAAQIRFQPDGDAIETGTITLCDSRGADKARAVIITASGKSKISETAAGGASLSCT